MTTAPDAARELAAGLSAERAALAALVNLLELEQDALAEGRSDDLTALAFDKDALAGRVAEASQRRTLALEKLGVKPERRGIDAWIRAHADALVADTWAAIVRLAEAGRALNAANGLMIEDRLRSTQQALGVLLGRAGGAALYGRDGQARADGPGRQLGAA